jgi:hypothetical protein
MSSGHDMTIPIRLEGKGIAPHQLQAVCHELSSMPRKGKLELHVDSACITEGVLELLPETGIVKLVLADGESKKLSKALSRMPIEIGATAGGREEDERAKRYGRNGFLALNAGLYPDLNRSPGIYHLALPVDIDSETRQAIYTWASPSMALRSAAVITGDEQEVSKRLPALQLAHNTETNGWPRHSYAIALEEGKTGELIFDGSPTLKDSIRYIPLKAFTPHDRTDGATTVITLRTSEDVDALVERFATFHSEGRIELCHPKAPIVYENTCRWIRYGGCSLPLLRRLSVDSDQQLSACQDSGHVGRVGDDYDQLVVCVKQRQQVEEVERGCATCEVRDECSHCVHLPNQWAGRYCDIRKRYPRSSLFFEISALPYLLVNVIDLPSEVYTARVSYDGLPPQYYQGPARGRPQGNRPVFISFPNQYIAWWRQSTKFIRLSAPLVYMAEAWWMGAERELLVEGLKRKFSVDDQTASINLDEGLGKLRAGGVING